MSWRQLILNTLPAQHTRQEQQEEDLCRKFERLYQKNKNYERKLNRFSSPAVRTTKTYWDYPQAQAGLLISHFTPYTLHILQRFMVILKYH